MHKIAKLLIFYCLLFAINGCATVYTLTSSEDLACTEECLIPSVYSGTAFDLCGVMAGDGGQGAAIMFWDLFFSVPADTLVLPYTVFKQIEDGSISNGESCPEDISPNKFSQHRPRKEPLGLDLAAKGVRVSTLGG